MSVSDLDIEILEAARKVLVRLGNRSIADPLEDLLTRFANDREFDSPDKCLCTFEKGDNPHCTWHGYRYR